MMLRTVNESDKVRAAERFHSNLPLACPASSPRRLLSHTMVNNYADARMQH